MSNQTLDLNTIAPGTILEGGGVAVVLEVYSADRCKARNLLTGEVVTHWGPCCRVVSVHELPDVLAEYDRHREYLVPAWISVVAASAEEAVQVAEDRIEDVEGAYLPKDAVECLS